MTNMIKDYYNILGVSEDCTLQELKSAYRKLARKWHPDIAGNTYITKFKEINEAYEILSNKEKKTEYDKLKKYYNYSSSPNKTKQTNKNVNVSPENTKKNNENSNKKKSFGFNWEEFFQKYKAVTNNYIKEPQKGKDINTDIEITILEAINGTTKVINMLQTHSCPKCHGRKFVNNNICSCCNGKGDVSDYKKFSVKIPSGIKEGAKIRLSGEGEKGVNGGLNGDLYITIHLKSPIEYQTEGNDIIKTISISPFEAVLGTQIHVNVPTGEFNVKIPENTQSGQKIRLSGCGMKSYGKIGDLIIKIEIQIPKTLSIQEIELYKKLRECASNSVR